MPEQTVAQQQVQGTVDPQDFFTPARGLPVTIDFRTDSKNPYSLAQDVLYDNGIVRVEMEKGFKWDGASIPTWVPILPWLLTMVIAQFYNGPILWGFTTALVLYAIRLLPYMQKMGLHARALAVHDKLYRAQKTSRVVSDAIAETIMQADGVPWDVRMIIYRRLRQLGWTAWWTNQRVLSAKTDAAKKSVEVSPSSLDAKKN